MVGIQYVAMNMTELASSMPTIACPYVLPLLLPHHSESSLSLSSPVIYAYDGELTTSLRAPRSYRSFRWSVLRCYRPHTGRLGPVGFVNDWLVSLFHPSVPLRS